MYRIGLTGGIGAGKSEVARILRDLGARVIDADSLGASVVEPGTRALARLVDEFGPEIAGPDGRLDRARLASIVFADPGELSRLNAIVHPALIAAILSDCEAEARANPDGVLVVDAALLVEWDILDMFDLVVVVTAPEKTRVERLTEGGMSEEEARRRMASQITDRERTAAGDVVLDNSGSTTELASEVGRLWESLPPISGKGTG